MIVNTLLSILGRDQVERLLVSAGLVKPNTIAGIKNKGGGVYAFCIYRGLDLIERRIVKIEPQRIRSMGSYIWRGYLE